MKSPVTTFIAAAAITVTIAIVASDIARADWSIDLSRRTQQMRRSELNKDAYGRGPASVKTFEGEEPPPPAEVPLSRRDTGYIEDVFDVGAPLQDIVILNTERGFVPNTIRLRKDGRYQIHVVNVNEKEKNVSFILDGFSEHHATFFGKVKTFKLEPRKEGVYSFLSPETAVEGKFIVFATGPDTPKLRVPATAATSGTSSTSEAMRP